MRTYKTPLLLTALLWAVVAFIAPAARAEDAAPSPEVQFVQKMGDKALVQLTDKTLSRAARSARAHQILRDNFDIPTIARFALGPYWREATEAEKTEYMSLFESMIVETYATRFEDYSGQSFKVDGARNDDERNSMVSSKIIQKGGPPVSVEWHIRKKDGHMKVVDVIVEKISMSVTQRDDFVSVIQGSGGKVSALIESMRTRQGKKK
jgi:phospholipid transport system substrate-binding protein